MPVINIQEILHPSDSDSIKLQALQEAVNQLRAEQDSDSTNSGGSGSGGGAAGFDSDQVVAIINENTSSGSGSGMTDAAAERILNEFKEKNLTDKLKESAKSIYDITKDTRKKLVEYGLESQETIDKYEQNFKNYVPLRGFETTGEEDFESIPGFSQKQVKGKRKLFQKKIKGTELFLTIEDTLAENATYNLALNSCIKDLNEGNILDTLNYIFSTSDVLDTLTLSGRLQDAYTLEEIENAWIMLFEENKNEYVWKIISEIKENVAFNLKQFTVETELKTPKRIIIFNNVKMTIRNEELIDGVKRIYGKPGSLYEEYSELFETDRNSLLADYTEESIEMLVYQIIVGVLVALLVFLIYIIRNLLLKNEKYEDVVKDQVAYLQNISNTVGEGQKHLYKLDEKGVFQSDDEVGYYFEQLKTIQKELDRYMLPENYGKEEKQS